jgi:hypothetical protein
VFGYEISLKTYSYELSYSASRFMGGNPDCRHPEYENAEVRGFRTAEDINSTVTGIAATAAGELRAGRGVPGGVPAGANAFEFENNPNNYQLRLFPEEPYNRARFYGNTPTRADRAALGAGPGQVVNHEPPLVQRYYDGDPSIGERPGFNMSAQQRAASAQDRSRMELQPASDSYRQGYDMKNYSQQQKEKYGF